MASLAYVAYGLARGIIMLYTIVTLPFYAICQCPCLKEDGAKEDRAKIVSRKDNEIIIHPEPLECKFVEEIVNHPEKVMGNLPQFFL